MRRFDVQDQLLREALTHRSSEEVGPNNERLEFLGDAVLQLVVSDHLFRTCPTASEGVLTRRRALTVSEPTLTVAARQIGLGTALRLSRGEEQTGGRERPSILSDAFEAVVAAVFLSSGVEGARDFVSQTLGSLMEAVQERDFKSMFQEWAQEHRKTTPTYRIVEEMGPDHSKTFRAQTLLGDERVGEGDGRSKKEAEQSAAEAAMRALNIPVDFA